MLQQKGKLEVGDTYDGDWVVTWISDGWITITNYRTGEEKEIGR